MSITPQIVDNPRVPTGGAFLENYSAAAENNKQPISAVLARELTEPGTVLEIGSGSGQHALYLARNLPHLQWQATELPHAIKALQRNLYQHSIANMLPPIALDVAKSSWLSGSVEVVFTANTLHIMSWHLVTAFFAGVGRNLGSQGRLCVYGPFRYGGNFTAPSNAQFDAWLSSRDPLSGIRDFEAVDALAQSIGCKLVADHAMPANNQLLIWQRN